MREIREMTSYMEAESAAHEAFMHELRGLGKLAAAIPCGIADGVIEIGQSLTPAAAADSLGNARDACVAAASYYATTPLKQVTRDAKLAVEAAGKAIERIYRAPAEEQGYLIGKVAVDLVAFECAAKIAKNIAALRCSSAEVELPEALRPSPTFAAHLGELVDNLSSNMKACLKKNHITVIPIQNLSSLYEAPASGLFVRARKGARIFIAEDSHILQDGTVMLHQLELTLQHELAHAVDCFSGLGGPQCWYSDYRKVREAFNADLADLSESQRQSVLDILGDGSKQTARREAVAEIVSRTAVPSATSATTFQELLRVFPRLTEIVRDESAPFQKVLK